MAQAAEIERRALAIVERLLDRPALRERLLRRECAEVRARVAALEAAGEDALRTGPGGLPTIAPDRIGPFRLDRLLGMGGMGGVWLGQRDDGLYEQQVAIKLIHTHLAPLAAAWFTEERRILARMEHPNIARLIDGGVTEGGHAFLVMEWVDGRPIDAAAEGLPLRDRIGLFIRAADAVQFAHARLVVHADLKPSNILVSGERRVKLIDFGVARLLRDEPVRTASPMTRAYASPERIAGRPPSTLDDIYALGVILREMTDADADRDLAAIAARATAPDEADRYGGVAAMIGDLERWRERLPVSARAPTIGYRAGLFLRRHRIGVALTALAMLLLAAAAGIATASYLAAERARLEATARLADARGTARYLLFRLSDTLERLPGSLPLRTEVAAVSQKYLDRLSTSAYSSPALRLESATGLYRLADRQGGPGRSNLGQFAAAKANLQQAERLLRDMPGADAARLRALALIAEAGIASAQENDFPAAERLLADARAAIARSGPEAALLRGDWLFALATLRGWQGRYPESIAAARQGLAAPSPPDAHAATVRRAGLYDILAESIYYGGDEPGSVVPYRQALDLLETAAARDPGDLALARKLARARWALASVMLELHRPKDALPLAEQAVTGAERVVQAEPTDAEAARVLEINQAVLAQALAANGQVDRAVALLSDGIAQRRRALAARPNEAARLRDYAITIAMLADVEADAGRIASACARYVTVRGLFDRLRREGRFAAMDDGAALRLVTEREAHHCKK